MPIHLPDFKDVKEFYFEVSGLEEKVNSKRELICVVDERIRQLREEAFEKLGLLAWLKKQ